MSDGLNELLEGFPVVVEMDVRWGDMDCFNHVNNVNYFRYFESARMAYFEALDIESFMGVESIGPILAATSCQYKFPLTYPDRISIGARCFDLEEDRFKQQYLVASHRFERIAAVGEGLIVSYDYRIGKKAPIPANVRQRIDGLEQDGAGR